MNRDRVMHTPSRRHVPSAASDFREPVRLRPGGLVLFCLILAGATFLLWFWRLDPWVVYDPYVGYEDDTGYYLVLGKALSSGRGYRMINQPGEPWHRSYPPGYPLIAAAVMGLSPSGRPDAAVVPLKVVSLLFTVAALPLLLLYWIRRGETSAMALGTGVLLMVHPLAITYAGAVMSEAAFTFASLLAFFLTDHVLGRAEAAARRLRWGEIGILAIAITWPFYLRAVGVTLVAAVIAYLLVKRRGRDAVGITGSVLLVVLPWSLMTFSGYGKRMTAAGILVLAGVGILSVLRRRPLIALGSAGIWLAGGYAVLQGWGGGPHTYVSFSVETYASSGLLTYLATVAWKAATYAGIYGKAVLGGYQGWLEGASGMATAGALIATGCMLLGWWRKVREGLGPAELYVVLYTLLLLITEPSPQIRYVVPLLPFLLLYFLRGASLLLNAPLQLVVKGRPWLAARVVPAIVTAILVATYLPVQAHLAAWATLPMGQRGTDGGAEGWWEAVGWVQTHAPSDAVVMSRLAQVMYLYTGRPSVRWAVESAPERTAQHILEMGAEYIVEDGFTGVDLTRYLRPALAILQGEGRVQLIHVTGGPLPSRIWRVNGNHREARRG